MIKTGTIILALIALIFGVDTILSATNTPTISEWFYDFLHNDPLIGFTTLIGLFTVLCFHFWFFRKERQYNIGMDKITPEQALQNLYLASRKANLTADDHKICELSAMTLQGVLKPKKEDKPTK